MNKDVTRAQNWMALAMGNQKLATFDPNALEHERQMFLERAAIHPWNYVTGNDPLTGRQLVWTKDEKDRKNPVKPFPRKAYLRALFDIMLEFDFVIVEKCRQMIISTTCCQFITWESSFTEARRWLISRTIEKDSKEMLRDKVRFPWSQTPQWYQLARPMTKKPSHTAVMETTDSYIQAVSENVANRTARGGSASGFLLDEAAFQDNSRDIVVAAAPMTARILMVSTPSLRPGGRFMKKKIDQAYSFGTVIDVERLMSKWDGKVG